MECSERKLALSCIYVYICLCTHTHTHTHTPLLNSLKLLVILLLEVGDPFQGSYLTLGNELSAETHVLSKQKTLLEKGA